MNLSAAVSDFREISFKRILSIVIALYLFRSAIPEFKIPFLILYAGVFIAFIAKFRNDILPDFRYFFYEFYLILFLVFLLFLSFLISDKIYLMAFKDVINSFILISFIFLLFFSVRTSTDLKLFQKHLTGELIIIAVLISLIYILDDLEIISYFHNESTFANLFGNDGEVNYIDYNFALIPCFFAIICIFYEVYSKHKNSLLHFAVLYLLSLNILLAGSRRGILVYLLMLGAAFVVYVIVLFYKNQRLNLLRKYLISFLLFSAFNVICFYSFFFMVNPEKQNDILRSLGSGNATVAKYKISSKFYRYYTLFNNKNVFSEWFWKNCADPKDPDSGWGYRKHKTVYPLSGENAGILPENVKGYLIDSTSNSNYYPGPDICESYTMFVALNVDNGEQYFASVYCFVSGEFNGNSVSFGNSASVIDRGLVSGSPVSEYDLSRIGEWQLLNVQFSCREAYIPLLMSITMKGSKDFSKLNGYVIFAYPQYRKNICQGNSLFEDCHDQPQKDLIANFPAKKIQLHNAAIIQNYFYGGKWLFPSNLLKSLSYQKQDDNDPIRRWVSKLISEDTVYYAYKSNITLDTISNPFVADRILRWKFAYQIFMKEFSWRQKIFGGGFNFLNWYGKIFMNDKTQSDYPHNPFLHILLYSGILGLLIYCIFIYKVFYYYIKYIKVYLLLFIFFLITFFFSFFSSGTPFDPPIMGFFSILPFLIHAVHKKIRKNL